MSRLSQSLIARSGLLAALITLAASVLIPGAALAAKKCPVSRPQTSMKSTIDGTEIIKTKSATDMTEWQIGHAEDPASGGQILGLGGGKTSIQLRSLFEILPVGGGHFCVIMQETHATYTSSPQIHVASNFELGSCEYSEVLAHEQKHVEALKLFHRRNQKNMRAQLKKVARTIPVIEPVPESGIEAAQNGLNAYVQSQMDRYFRKIMQDLIKTQQEIDSPEEYARVASKCRKWGEKLAPGYKK